MKQRLDLALVARGLAESRERARRLIMAGEVRVNGQRQDKASAGVGEQDEVTVDQPERYVSRAGHKLEGALRLFGLDVTGRRAIDIGSSTGGFTDCLLQHGAAHVTAVDVGTNQLVYKLRSDPRVAVFEGLNARHLKAESLQDPDGAALAPFDLLVTDVSFISLRLILPPGLALLRPGGLAVALIKPQFEAGRDQVGKGGIVRDEAVRERVVADLRAWLAERALEAGLIDGGVAPSPLAGRDGNREFLWLIRKS
ncbi:MAG: TlyA family RNA methyltransferase [Verrucomicrobiota bacterium]